MQVHIRVVPSKLRAQIVVDPQITTPTGETVAGEWPVIWKCDHDHEEVAEAMACARAELASRLGMEQVVEQGS